MERLTAFRNGLMALALTLGAAACAGNGADEPYEGAGEDMERPPAMDTPAGSAGSLENQ